ncbi:MAG: cupin domain-containing protein [Tannerella sp.]|jgi:quercetin dioxygenase-like cupin family protein|nr:cupin domain-containing protein [Tannerella sp.]
MKTTIYFLIYIFTIPFISFAQNKQCAISGDIESYIDRFDENKVDKNKNGWAHYYIPRGMADTLTVKMSCVYEGTQTHSPHTHHEDEAFYIIKGPVNFHINGEERILDTGDFVYTPSGSFHNIQRVGNDTIKYLVLKRETIQSVSKPYKVGKSDYTFEDCCYYISKDPEWIKGTASHIIALDKTFADGFEIILERAIDKTENFPANDFEKDKQTAVYIISGDAEVSFGGQHAILNTDNTFYCPKGESYLLKKTSDEPLIFVAISTY